MKQVVYDIALEVGGSHYPGVGGRLLEQSIMMAVQKCMAIAHDNGDAATAEAIASHFELESRG